MLEIANPWEYLEAWRQSHPHQDYSELGWIQARMHSRWPGPYRVLQVGSDRGWATEYALVFDSALEEVMFRLRWA